MDGHGIGAQVLTPQLPAMNAPVQVGVGAVGFVDVVMSPEELIATHSDVDGQAIEASVRWPSPLGVAVQVGVAAVGLVEVTALPPHLPTPQQTVVAHHETAPDTPASQVQVDPAAVVLFEINRPVP